jgi:tetratricopeptide (TPR) repeat protein
VILHWVERIWRRRSAVSVSSNAGVAAGRDILNSPITIINQNNNAEVLKAIAALSRQLVAGSPMQATVATETRVGEAIGDIAKGALEGDKRLQTALDLLRANNVSDAVRMLQAVAEDKTARIKQDSRDAAAAYRNLGAIAGLGDPRQALEAYLKAVQFDADDVESLLWIGWIELERGRLDAAEQRFRGLLASSEGEGAAHNHYWARLGLGDIRVQRGDLSVARADYLEAAGVAERLAEADPGNAGWQRDLSVSHNKIGDVQ